MQIMCLFLFNNSSKLGINVVIALCISFSTLSFDRYFEFTASAENPALQKYDVANGCEIHKAFLATS